MLCMAALTHNNSGIAGQNTLYASDVICILTRVSKWLWVSKDLQLAAVLFGCHAETATMEACAQYPTTNLTGCVAARPCGVQWPVYAAKCGGSGLGAEITAAAPQVRSEPKSRIAAVGADRIEARKSRHSTGLCHLTRNGRDDSNAKTDG